MQQTNLTTDSALRARLTAYRQTLLQSDAQPDEAPLVCLPGGDTLPLTTQPGKGLRAAGMLLAYALLGCADAQAESLIAALEQTVTERQLRRLCTLSVAMLREDPDFSLPNLLACLRTAIAYLPGENETAPLPGLYSETVAPVAAEKSVFLPARCAFAGNAAILYFSLPEGAESAVIDGKTYTKEQCRAGVCIAADTTEVQAQIGDTLITLRAEDPLRHVRMRAGFRFGRVFLCAARIPRPLWRRLTAWVLITGPAQTLLPDFRLITSCGEQHYSAVTLTGHETYLRCPPLDPHRDQRVLMSGAGVRYIELTEEG